MKGLQRSIARGAAVGTAGPPIRGGTLRVSGSMTITGATGNGWGTVAVGDFPEGNILLLGAVAYLQFSGAGSDADLADTWQGDYAVGTTPTADATLGGTDADLIPSTALAAATAEVSPKTRGTQSDGSLCGVVLDNTDGSLEINVNLSIDDANIAGNDSVVTVDGELHLAYVLLGDD